MKIYMNQEYLTGNPGMDSKIKKALEKENKKKIIVYPQILNFRELTLEDYQIKEPVFIFNITPIGKPRMTQKDKWYERENVKNYWLYKDDLNNLSLQNKFVPSNNMRLIFYLPFPKSWTNATKASLNKRPHTVKPDIDNICKGFLDAFMKDDSSVWHTDCYKYWTIDKIGRIEVTHL